MTRCVLCRHEVDRYVYSRFTGFRYCTDVPACDRRRQDYLNGNHRRELAALGGGQPRQTPAARAWESHARLFELGPPGSCPPPSGPPTTASALVRVGGPLGSPGEPA